MDFSNYTRWEITRKILDNNPAQVGPKQIAAHLETSLSNILKWGEDPLGSGSDMPSKYIKPFSQFTKDTRLVDWFRYTSFPAIDTMDTDGRVIDQLLNLDVLRGHLSDYLKDAIAGGKEIEEPEAATVMDILSEMSREINITKEEINLMRKARAV